jgi:hypothetical protein
MSSQSSHSSCEMTQHDRPRGKSDVIQSSGSDNESEVVVGHTTDDPSVDRRCWDCRGRVAMLHTAIRVVSGACIVVGVVELWVGWWVAHFFTETVTLNLFGGIGLGCWWGMIPVLGASLVGFRSSLTTYWLRIAAYLSVVALLVVMLCVVVESTGTSYFARFGACSSKDLTLSGASTVSSG